MGRSPYNLYRGWGSFAFNSPEGRDELRRFKLFEKEVKENLFEFNEDRIYTRGPFSEDHFERSREEAIDQQSFSWWFIRTKGGT